MNVGLDGKVSDMQEPQAAEPSTSLPSGVLNSRLLVGTMLWSSQSRADRPATIVSVFS